MRAGFLLCIGFLLFGVCKAGNKVIYVGDRLVQCNDTRECLQLKTKAKAAWQNYFDYIDGFNYELGFEYKILVKVTGHNGTTDAFKHETYKFVKLLSRKKTDYNPATRLDGKKWFLASMYDTQRNLTFKDSAIYIFFDTKTGKVNGTTTCNSFSGPFKSEGATMTIGPLGATKRLCQPENKMTFEKLILKFIQEATIYTVEHGKVTLFAPNGENIAFTTE
jgi:heat shock protein HslJ